MGETPEPLRIGVLACQGGFAAHIRALSSLGAEAWAVRAPRDFDRLDGLVIPGGESTTIAMAIERDGLAAPIRELATGGLPVLGTCAGMIICARDHLGLVDASARRNAFGRQAQSFEADLELEGIGPEPIRAVFIRAPWLEDCGPEVEVLARWDDHPVAVREGKVVLCSFHPELAEDSRVHALLMAMATTVRERRSDRQEAGSS